MRRVGSWAFVLGAAACMIVWAALVLFGTLQGWWRQPLAPSGDAHAFADAAIHRLEAEHNGNVIFVLIQAGKPVRDGARQRL